MYYLFTINSIPDQFGFVLQLYRKFSMRSTNWPIDPSRINENPSSSLAVEYFINIS